MYGSSKHRYKAAWIYRVTDCQCGCFIYLSLGITFLKEIDTYVKSDNKTDDKNNDTIISSSPVVHIWKKARQEVSRGNDSGA